MASVSNKELSSSNKSINIYPEDITENLLQTLLPNGTDKIPIISVKWMERHYLSHLMYYFLNKQWIKRVGGKFEDFGDVGIKEFLLTYEKLWFVHDLYIMYIYWIQFNENIFSKSFTDIEENKKLFINVSCGELGGHLRKKDEKEIKVYFGTLLNNFNLVSKNDKKEFLLLEQIAWLLWLINKEFEKDFYISSCIFNVYTNSNNKSRNICEQKIPIYVIPIIQKIFWKKKSILVTKENYSQLKITFNKARLNYMKELNLDQTATENEINTEINTHYK